MSLLLTAFLAAAALGGAAAPVADRPAGEKVRCKRFTETGSLARVRKECHTEREWAEIQRRVQEDFGKLQGAGFKGGGN